ncbi:MAG: DUF3137 domain-containing protein [Deltaproteobacteria bacterium]|nr:DUF3137 domain-containing protein [Deltaproteobacteria bacterium]
MSMLRQLFGPSRDEVWQKLSHEVGGDFNDGGFWKGSKLQVKHGEWTITLDTYTVSTGKSSTTYTRIRAPYINGNNFRFTIYRKSIFSGIGKALGMQDVEIGYPQFDDDFIIKGNDENLLRTLFANIKIRELISAQPRIHLQVKDDEGYFGSQFPRGVDELYFQTVGVIKDTQRLKQLFGLFAEVLNHLCHIGSAYEDDPRINLK